MFAAARFFSDTHAAATPLEAFYFSAVSPLLRLRDIIRHTRTRMRAYCATPRRASLAPRAALV